ncbi:hypothetical protein E2C01_048297 [Portunus trituberculatus]|uniref:Uncharacterized protein n=1 Tax=Portunus trituberculatus TaxID=210409 RepID=A0A5B7GA74_PORTR|nr:hypothetical protein [Portunus trituberculatus]
MRIKFSLRCNVTFKFPGTTGTTSLPTRRYVPGWLQVRATHTQPLESHTAPHRHTATPPRHVPHRTLKSPPTPRRPSHRPSRNPQALNGRHARSLAE